ncbi:NeuD/PglB/VioB family sugar acetyltransferase [Roseateles sp.]|uniref:NeuD/PglB/VioB family sugar acetyltransferase n=1 Tax=Roseateles sp. TaxID=1971397 RepID=UPI0039E8BE98
MATSNLVIVNAGNFGREVHVWARQAIQAGAPWRIKGFLDSRRDILDGFDYGSPILAAPEDYRPEPGDVFLCAVGEPQGKRRYTAMLEERGAEFTSLIHPTALVGHNVRIGSGAIICPMTQLSCDIELGRHVVFGTLSSGAHDVRIGSYSQISGGCQINGHAALGEGVFLGASATVLPRARVEDWSYVGAGSVVLKRVKTRTKVFGNPAVQIGVLD